MPRRKIAEYGADPERDAFEKWYLAKMLADYESLGMTTNTTRDDLIRRRNGKYYGHQRGYLNDCWETWQATGGKMELEAAHG
jgi:hypothetical protein